MNTAESFAKVRGNEADHGDSKTGVSRPILDHAIFAIYALALAVSISVWLIAVRSPLWLDETGSYWQIDAGFWGIWARQFQSLAFPAYACILWFSTKILGASEVALRIPSILAMLGAVALLYRAAREVFDREIALIAVIIFCLHPIVIFESIDVRPYAFAALATNAAIFLLLRLRRSDSLLLAALFGSSAAAILWFQYLFAVMLPALLLCFFVVKIDNRRAMWRQFLTALAAFAIVFLPAVPGLLYLFHTASTHVFEPAPHLSDLFWTLAPRGLSIAVFLTALYVALTTTRTNERIHFDRWKAVLCLSLALIPILLLYGISTETSIHMFTARHRLIAIPGIALCEALFLSPFRSRVARLLFCVVFVAGTAWVYFSSPLARQHGYTWKYALQYAEKNAAQDQAPVLICSDFPESDYAKMPLLTAKESFYFAPLSYYKLTVPVVPLPRALNAEAIRVATGFLQAAEEKHQRFLALAFWPSYPTLDWLARSAAPDYTVRTLGVFDGVEVREFMPRSAANGQR